MLKRLTLKQAQKLIADWLDNEDNDTENVKFDDSSDKSEQDHLELNRDADVDVCKELPSSVVDSDDDSADHTDHIAAACRKHYEMSAFVAVDEMLSSFRGKCPFRVYMPSKSAKYGMKIWVVADSVTAYCGYMQAYLGKVGNTVERGQGARVVKNLCQHLCGTGRNITMDNFFTQYTLAQELL